ncbi:hypothetical protein J6X90_03585 [Candidatus Saccharibacteria bacterium]|nr:hypothetical protein [Candidatus Saccharibacteria bacterium]
MEEMQEYLGLSPCSCGGQVVMMSDRSCIGNYCGYNLFSYSAFVTCKRCHRMTTKFSIQGIENENDWHEVMLRAKNTWNTYHT